MHAFVPANEKSSLKETELRQEIIVSVINSLFNDSQQQRLVSEKSHYITVNYSCRKL